MDVPSVLHALNLDEVNSGGSSSSRFWTSPHSDSFLTSYNPATGQVLARVAPCSGEDLSELLIHAEQAFNSWRHVPAPERGEAVRLIGQALRAKKEFLGALVSLEVGKIKAEGLGEVQEMIDMADFAVSQSRMLYGYTMHSERRQHRMYEQWHPLGIVGIITAFNFPVAVWAWNAFLAAIAGDTVLWKPSPKAPLCALAVQHICNQVMEDIGYTGVFSLFITDQPGLAEAMVQDNRVSLVSFTGSVPVGQQVARTVASRLGRTLLELSGNNAVIVDDTADLDLAIRAIIFGAVGTAGQRCTTTRRLFVHESCYEPLMTRLLAAYRRIVIGDPLKPGVLMGPLIDRQAVLVYEDALLEAQREGGEILYGGQVLDGAGHFVEPAVVKMKSQTAVMRRETFAPILYVMTFHCLDEAIKLNNDVPQGLSSAMFTFNIRHSERFLSVAGSDCGIANINIGTSGAEIGGAFGGEKATGGGREAGSDSWKAYMRRQTITINWGVELPLAQGIIFESDHIKEAP